jgi:C1A family cysteine protease
MGQAALCILYSMHSTNRLSRASSLPWMQCGACWAFAAVAALESRVLIQSKKKYSQYPIDLSEQQLVSPCGSEKSWEHLCHHLASLGLA